MEYSVKSKYMDKLYKVIKLILLLVIIFISAITVKGLFSCNKGNSLDEIVGKDIVIVSVYEDSISKKILYRYKGSEDYNIVEFKK